MAKTFVIAEAGSSWLYGGSRNSRLRCRNALKMIEIAAWAGAQCVKFQWTSDPKQMAHRRHVDDEHTYDQLMWPEEWHKAFSQQAKNYGLEYACTVFLPGDVQTIAPHVSRFKIASLEAQDEEMWQEMAKYKKSVIYSTGGMAWDDLLAVFYFEHPIEMDIVFLHCTAAYPVPVDQLNLNAIRYAQSLPLDGLSDHSGHQLTGALAVAAGATIVECHFRLDRTPKDNPDYPHSHSPGSLKKYIENIRLAERMMGDGIKKIEKSEEPLLKHRVIS